MQWLVIIGIVLGGIFLAIQILTTRKQVDTNPFDDDGPRPTTATQGLRKPPYPKRQIKW